MSAFDEAASGFGRASAGPARGAQSPGMGRNPSSRAAAGAATSGDSEFNGTAAKLRDELRVSGSLGGRHRQQLWPLGTIMLRLHRHSLVCLAFLSASCCRRDLWCGVRHPQAPLLRLAPRFSPVCSTSWATLRSSSARLMPLVPVLTPPTPARRCEWGVSCAASAALPFPCAPPPAQSSAPRVPIPSPHCLFPLFPHVQPPEHSGHGGRPKNHPHTDHPHGQRPPHAA